MGRYTLIHTNTHRLSQTPKDTYRHTQIHIDDSMVLSTRDLQLVDLKTAGRFWRPSLQLLKAVTHFDSRPAIPGCHDRHQDTILRTSSTSEQERWQGPWRKSCRTSAILTRVALKYSPTSSTPYYFIQTRSGQQ